MALSPMMQQYLKIHEQEPDALLFFRVGDFYEMFFDDAITTSKELDLVLTGKDCGLEERAPMCGVPHHAIDVYVAKLVEKGYRVAICEQMTPPGKGIVEREIVRVVTSGTVTDPSALKEDKNNYIMSIYYNKLEYGIAYADISTGEMCARVISGNNADERFFGLLGVLLPSEVIVNGTFYQSPHIKERAEMILSRNVAPLKSKYFITENCISEITRQLNVYSINATGLEKHDSAIKSCGALLSYIRETQKGSLSQISKIDMKLGDELMVLDYATKRNLEITETMRLAEKRGSLLWVLDNTVTAIGARTLRKWLGEPLLSKTEIEKRHDSVSYLVDDIFLIEDIQRNLEKMSDIERLLPRLNNRTIKGRELLSLASTISAIPKMRDLLINARDAILKDICLDTDDLSDLGSLIELAISEDCSNNIGDGTLIKYGYNRELDELKDIKDNIGQILAEIEAREKESTGIRNLKIKYNKVFGYFIEVTKSNLDMVPDYFIRKQTLVNAERFVTEELKEIEYKLLTAHDKVSEVETAIYNDILDKLNANIARIKDTSERIGILDTLCSLAYTSYKNKYVRPYINEEGIIKIEQGRHPVVESLIGRSKFIPNDTYLDMKDNTMAIITGPNMAGKSTYIRQVAIIALMNQIGCFVPASDASLCIVDRIFTRVGASDDLAAGQSTFMVEMGEVSNILKNASRNSLVILDEVGRGTSTLDGLSIAWAVAEFLADKEMRGCKSLFATHYHELTQIVNTSPGIVNYHIATEQTIDG
ncbi:MAG: DNA mismatch repair protein MutS, partial [Anaerofustis stercorihominis]|nr:DNA mismatch repair protein MutS [Anaerofustis stercorihominis]